jgi:energy-converting hydrogenase Eha subunit A
MSSFLYCFHYLCSIIVIVLHLLSFPVLTRAQGQQIRRAYHSGIIQQFPVIQHELNKLVARVANEFVVHGGLVSDADLRLIYGKQACV